MGGRKATKRNLVFFSYYRVSVVQTPRRVLSIVSGSVLDEGFDTITTRPAMQPERGTAAMFFLSF
jgi:hypothetical protein